MRRTLPVILTAALLFAACGSDGDSVSENSGSTPVATDSSAAEGSLPVAASTPGKPTVDTPEDLPTELQTTVLREGSGSESVEGDTVVVDYVGVRSTDGVEFDNSYDPRGQMPAQPFNVVVGTGMVIEGWDQGLAGVQAGEMLQLDIPSDLAYGEAARGDIIGENEALTFVIEVRAVIPPVDLEGQEEICADDPNVAACEPTEPGVDPSEGATELTTVDLRDGEGEALQPGQTGIIRYVLFRGDNGVLLETSWEGEPFPFKVEDSGFPVLAEGVEGMKVGGRRAITFPPIYPDFGFGPEGNPTGGLPAETDVVIVVDLLGVYGTPD